MAEAVLNIVVDKLASIIEKEMEVLVGVEKKIERVHRELIRIRCCLRDADSKRKEDARVQNWLNELREVAYRIEDAIDTFFLKVEDHRQNDTSLLQIVLKKLWHKPLKVNILYKLGNELEDIQNELEEISKSRVHYGITDLQVKSKGEAVIMPLRRATYQQVDETEVVGMQANKNNILKLLRPEHTPRRTVLTIVGPGGLGKTTLAHMVYKSVKEDFDYHIMLSISQQFSVIDLLKKMLGYSILEKQDMGDLSNKLRIFLCKKRYLIILDDVWTVDLWNQLKYSLPDVKNGSRVLITSRFFDVAKSADSEITPYELNFLDDRKSLNLLLTKALPYQDLDEECPSDLLELAYKLSKKCKGLPLALIVLGGILSTKEPSYSTWDRVLQTMNWHSDGKYCMRILAMSYEDMPYYLKACFQYLASFPEDHVISATRLIRMWVAEGFIPLEGRPTIEIMAADCLEELSTRSMVQVSSRSQNGSIKHFQVHDLLRELAMREAGHENFVTVFSQASNNKKSNTSIIRRASLQIDERNQHAMEYVGPNTRSLQLFDPRFCGMTIHCSNFRLLKVLEIVGTSEMPYVLESLDELIHLKYLGLRGLQTDLSSCSFHRMKSLETLDVRGSQYCRPRNKLWTLSDELWTIGTLMHVLVDDYQKYSCKPLILKGTLIRNLHTLKWITVKRACDIKLPNLRKLGIRNVSGEWISMTSLLQTLPFVVSLGISGFSLPMEMIYPKALSNYQNLQSLHLRGAWPQNVKVDASLFPPHLVKLTLYESNLNHNPMPELGKLNSLKKVCLKYSALADDWEARIICAEGFPVLQYLKIGYHSNIKDLTVAHGIMPKLKYLEVDEKVHFHLPPELQHVTVNIGW